MPLPQACALDPSEFRMSIQASMPCAFGSWIAMIWSNWVCGSAFNAIAASGVTLSGRPRMSTTRILLPSPFILANSTSPAIAFNPVGPCRSRPYMAETAFNYQSADMLRHRYRVPARLELSSRRAHAHAKPLKVCMCGSACAWPSAFFRDFRSLQVIVSPRCTQDRSCAWTAQPNRAWRPGGGLIGGTSFNAPAMPFTSLPSPHVTASGQGAGSRLPANVSRNTPATEAGTE